ncbi:lipid-binding protein [Mariniflexile fucanivorans]|uniref:lipid-binding protein n=1 Tax=Mariniflexile fucanivorans TaxID=264023 RepID=UPI0014053C33|nr:lipid-binding protein [Mariniflexile fucanivorans]
MTVDKSAVSEMSGDWHVETFVDGDLAIGYQVITVSNTPEDDGTAIQINDHGNIWEFNAAVPADISSLTFAGSNLESIVDDYEITVSVTNGSITKNGTTSTSGRTVDKISFDIEFSDDPGTIYHIEGYKRTGFLEDEH